MSKHSHDKIPASNTYKYSISSIRTVSGRLEAIFFSFDIFSPKREPVGDRRLKHRIGKKQLTFTTTIMV